GLRAARDPRRFAAGRPPRHALPIGLWAIPAVHTARGCSIQPPGAGRVGGERLYVLWSLLAKARPGHTRIRAGPDAVGMAHIQPPRVIGRDRNAGRGESGG